MNGQIRVQSEPGKGTIFGIELPFEHVPTTPLLYLPHSPEYMPRAISDTSGTPLGTPATPGDGPKRYTEPTVEPILESDDTPKMSSSVIQTSPSRSQTMDHSRTGYPFPKMDKAVSDDSRRESLNILIAEDNPINSRLLSRRLQKLGHIVEVTVDGQECADHFKLTPEGIDVILMDIQVYSRPGP